MSNCIPDNTHEAENRHISLSKRRYSVTSLPLWLTIYCLLYTSYLDKNPYGYCHINFDKIRKLKAAIVDPSLYEKKSAKQLKEILSEKEYEVTQNNEDEDVYKRQILRSTSEPFPISVAPLTGSHIFPFLII